MKRSSTKKKLKRANEFWRFLKNFTKQIIFECSFFRHFLFQTFVLSTRDSRKFQCHGFFFGVFNELEKVIQRVSCDYQEIPEILKWFSWFQLIFSVVSKRFSWTQKIISNVFKKFPVACIGFHLTSWKFNKFVFIRGFQTIPEEVEGYLKKVFRDFQGKLP